MGRSYLDYAGNEGVEHLLHETQGGDVEQEVHHVTPGGSVGVGGREDEVLLGVEVAVPFVEQSQNLEVEIRKRSDTTIETLKPFQSASSRICATNLLPQSVTDHSDVDADEEDATPSVVLDDERPRELSQVQSAALLGRLRVAGLERAF